MEPYRDFINNEVQNCWGAIYAAVNVINVFMEGLKTKWDGGKLTGKITQAEYNQYTSEALALRAMCYFDLVRLYANHILECRCQSWCASQDKS